MTLKQVIEEVDRQKANAFTNEEKTKWVTNCEIQIAEEIFNVDSPAYEWEADQDTELLLTAPFEDIYILYVMSQIDFRNADYGRYNNELSQFDQRFSDAQAWFLRRLKPKRKWFRWFP